MNITKNVQGPGSQLQMRPNDAFIRVFENVPEEGKMTVYNLDFEAYNAIKDSLSGVDDNDLPIIEAAFAAQ